MSSTLNCRGHVVEGLEDVEQQARGHGDVAETLHGAGLDLDAAHEGGLQVGGADGEHPFVEVEMEAVDDGHRVVGGQNAAQQLQLAGKHLAVDDEFHIVVLFFVRGYQAAKIILFFDMEGCRGQFFFNSLLVELFADPFGEAEAGVVVRADGVGIVFVEVHASRDYVVLFKLGMGAVEDDAVVVHGAVAVGVVGADVRRVGELEDIAEVLLRDALRRHGAFQPIDCLAGEVESPFMLPATREEN